MKRSELIKFAQPHYDKTQIEELKRAVDLAVAKHAGQKRLSGEEYLIHPLSVATILIEWKMDMDSIIAGVLHDTLEDTGLALNDIEQAFGKDIAFLVDGVTQVSKARSGMGDLSSYLP
ncbi:MAG TPA: HD domain-containing protein, partial [Candidatus Saccharimonadales bacterium]